MSIHEAHQIQTSETMIIYPLNKHFPIQYGFLSPCIVSYRLHALFADTVAPFGQSLVVFFFASSVFVISISSCF